MTQYTLHQPSLRPLPLGTVRPAGWLSQQLAIQAQGISGHLDEFWPDIRDSQWFGGNAEAWERAPYWLDGLIPLAYLLDDTRLKAKVVRYLDEIICRQQDDGWLGPRTMIAAAGARAEARYDLWGQILATKAPRPILRRHRRRSRCNSAPTRAQGHGQDDRYHAALQLGAILLVRGAHRHLLAL